MPKLYVIWSLFTLNFVNYYRVIQLDWSIGFWWVLLSSFQELSFILLMVWTECSIYANYLLSPCFLMLFPNAAIPLNKQLYTFSYVCVTSGAAALVFSALYIMVCFFFPHEISFFFSISIGSLLIFWRIRPMLLKLRLGWAALSWVSICWECKVQWVYIKFNIILYCVIYQVDILGLRYLFLPLEWIGMNAMLVYVMAAEGIFAGFINGWYYDDPHNTLVHHLKMLLPLYLNMSCTAPYYVQIRATENDTSSLLPLPKEGKHPCSH